MAKRFIIKEKSTGKFYHLSISKGSYKIRDYSEQIEQPKEIDYGKVADLDTKVWNKYEQQDIAPYHSIDDIEFWRTVLSQKTVEGAKKATLTETSEQVNETASRIKLPFILTVIIASLGKFIGVDMFSVNVSLFSVNFQSTEILAAIVDVLLIIVLVVLAIQLSKLLKLIIELLSAYLDLHNEKQMIDCHVG